MTQFRCSIDKFKVDLFQGRSGYLWNQRFSEHENFFLRTNNTSSNHYEIVSNNTIMGETSQGGNIFISQISISGSVIFNSGQGGFTDSINLFIHLSSVVITQLTSSWDTNSYSSRMPCSNATNFSVTSMRFLLEMFNTPSLHDTLETFTLGNTENINHFVVGENRVNLNFLFEVRVGKVYLLSSRSTVNLNFEDVILLLSQLRKGFHLSSANSSDNSAVFLDSLNRNFDRFFFFFVFFGIFGKSLLL